MSQLRTCSVNISNPNDELLTKAMQEIAKELGAEVTDRVTDFYKTTSTVRVGIRHPVLCPGGYGVAIKPDGSMEVIGDEYGGNMKLERFQKMVQQRYTSKAIIKATMKAGFRVEVKKQAQKIYIMGVA